MSHRLPFNTYIYFLAQSINLTTAVMSVTMGAIVGAMLAPAPWLSTIPYGFQFLVVMLITYPASRLMAAIGRKKSFLLAALPLALSGCSGFLAVEKQSFILLLAAHSLLGAYIAFANFSRFAATDNIAADLKPRAISLVVAGGVVAAVAGPMLTTHFKDVEHLRSFSACYAVFIALALISFVLNMLVKEPARSPSDNSVSTEQHIDIVSTLKDKIVLLAIALGAMGYGLMNLLMIMASLYMSDLHVHFSEVTSAIQWHVLSMFAPSFITGMLINRLGLKTIIYSGIVLILVSSLINANSQEYSTLMVSLIALGLGWNFTYIGGSALLTNALENSPASAIKAQGVGDLGISVMATIGAFAPAFALAWIGWTGTNLISAGICVTLLIVSVVLLGRRSFARKV